MTNNHKMLWVDVSHYQPKLEYQALYDGGVRGLCAKIGQGMHRDPWYERHITAAEAVGMRTAGYLWFDPMVKLRSQLETVLYRPGPALDFITVDIEQYWQDWREWYLARQGKGKITKIFSAYTLSGLARSMVLLLRDYYQTRVVVYTSRSFIQSWAPKMSGWLDSLQVPLWLAQYPYSRDKVKLDSWDDLYLRMPKQTGPVLPAPCSSWHFWQWSGDKFTLPGTGGAIDLNWFNGTEQTYQTWLQSGTMPVAVEPLRMRVVYTVNVRDMPSQTAHKIGRLTAGQIIEVDATVRKDGEVWRKHRMGWSVSYWRNTHVMLEVP